MWPFGPITEAWRIARLDRAFAPAREMSGALATDQLARLAVKIAADQIGRGEVGPPNCGPDVEQWISPARPPQNYCAGFAGWCYEQAAASLDVPLPFRRSLGAKRLGKNVGAVGRVFSDVTTARAGDLVVWHRGADGAWSGHVALIETVHDEKGITVIEADSGPRVRRRAHDLTHERFSFFASLRGTP